MTFEQKMQRTEELAVAIGYAPYGVRDTNLLFGQEISDKIWGWIDGLYQKWIMNRITGRCSLRDSLDFDMGKQEDELDQTIQQFAEIAAHLEA